MMPLPLPPDARFEDIISWLDQFEQEYGYSNVARKWEQGNASALRGLEKEDLKDIFGVMIGANLYNAIHGEGKKFLSVGDDFVT